MISLATLLSFVGAGYVNYLVGGMGIAGALSTVFGFFKPVGGGSLKLIGIALVLAAGFVYHYATTASLETALRTKAEQVNKLVLDNSVLKMDKERLETSNKSLEAALSFKDRVNKELMLSVEKLQSDDAEIERKLSELHTRINQNPAIDTADGNGAVELFVNRANKDLKCELANFTRFNGRCVEGRWVEN